MESKRLIGPWELFKQAWNIYLKNWQKILGLVIAPLILGGLSYLFAGNKIIFLIISIIAVIFAMFSRLALLVAISSGDPMPSVSDSYKKSMQFFWAFVWVSILSALASFGGFLLLIIPGIIIGVLLTFSNYTLVIDGRKGMSALTLSWAYVKGYWWPIFGRFLFAALIIFLANVLITAIVPGQEVTKQVEYPGIGLAPVRQESLPDQIANFVFSLIFVLPFMTIYGLQMYKNLKEIKAGTLVENEEQGIAKKLKIFSILGIVAVILAIALAFLVAMFAVQNLLQNVNANMPSSPIVPFLDFLPK